MKNQPGTMKNHENQPGTMKNRENQPGTIKYQLGTMKNHENPSGTMKNQPGTIKTIKTQPTSRTQLEKVMTFGYVHFSLLTGGYRHSHYFLSFTPC